MDGVKVTENSAEQATPVSRPAQVRILEAAIVAFASAGYAGTSLRAIASKAGCDVALIPYYFGSKAELFRQCTAVVVGQAAEIPSVAQVGRENAARELTRAIIERFYDQRASSMITLIIRSAAAAQTTPPAVSEYVDQILQSFFDDAVGTSGDSREDRLPSYMFGASMLGAMILRNIVEVPALAELTEEELIELMSPELQAVIERDIEEGHIEVSSE